MVKVLKVAVVSLTLLWTSSHLCSAMSGFEEAREHPLVKRALQQEEDFRNATANDIKTTLYTIKDTCKSNGIIDPEDLKAQILERMKTDLDLLAILDANLKGLNVGTEVGYPLYYHKMKEALMGAIPLIQSSCDDLLDGNVPKGYAYQSSQITRLGDNPNNIYGNHKGTYLKTALFNVCLQLGRQIKTLDFDEMKTVWAETSPSYHITPLPKKLSYDQFVEIDGRFSTFPYFLARESWKSGYFFFAHSGYAFGGDRYNPHFPQGKLYGPEDCSSWIAKLTESPCPFSTLDQLYGYRSYLPEKGAYIWEGWSNTPKAKYLQRYRPVVIENPLDIKPGQIYVSREFSNEDPMMKTTGGTGGHTALVLGSEGNKVITLSYARSLPTLDFEGFGVKAFSVQTAHPTKVMFFNAH